MEFSTKSDPTPPRNEGAGIGGRDPHQLYNKKLQIESDGIWLDDFTPVRIDGKLIKIPCERFFYV